MKIAAVSRESGWNNAVGSASPTTWRPKWTCGSSGSEERALWSTVGVERGGKSECLAKSSRVWYGRRSAASGRAPCWKQTLTRPFIWSSRIVILSGLCSEREGALSMPVIRAESGGLGHAAKTRSRVRGSGRFTVWLEDRPRPRPETERRAHRSSGPDKAVAASSLRGSSASVNLVAPGIESPHSV